MYSVSTPNIAIEKTLIYRIKFQLPQRWFNTSICCCFCVRKWRISFEFHSHSLLQSLTLRLVNGKSSSSSHGIKGSCAACCFVACWKRVVKFERLYFYSNISLSFDAKPLHGQFFSSAFNKEIHLEFLEINCELLLPAIVYESEVKVLNIKLAAFAANSVNLQNP